MAQIIEIDEVIIGLDPVRYGPVRVQGRLATGDRLPVQRIVEHRNLALTDLYHLMDQGGFDGGGDAVIAGDRPVDIAQQPLHAQYQCRDEHQATQQQGHGYQQVIPFAGRSETHTCTSG